MRLILVFVSVVLKNLIRILLNVPIYEFCLHFFGFSIICGRFFKEINRTKRIKYPNIYFLDQQFYVVDSRFEQKTNLNVFQVKVRITFLEKLKKI